jgi:type I restriction enzyme S subunit
MMLSDVCDFIVDCPHSTVPDEGKGYPIIRTPNIGKGRLILDGVQRVSQRVYSERNQRAVPRSGDLIFAREAPAGNVALITDNDGKVCLGQRTVLIRPDFQKVDPAFLVYYILAPEQQYKLLGTANGATVAHVNLPIIRKMPLDLPEIESQHKIAGVLSAYDNLIENNQRQIKLLEEAAHRLYKEWFVNLHFPGYEDNEVVDGVPEGWHRGVLKELINVNYGKDHKTKAPNPGNIPVYGSGGLMRKCNKSLYSGEAVLIPRKGSLNNIMYVNEEFWTVDTMFYATMKREHTALFVYFFISSYDMYAMNIGAAVPSMTVKILDAMSVLIPSDDLLKKYDDLVQMFFIRIASLTKQNEYLIEARDRLLLKLIGGEIEV